MRKDRWIMEVISPTITIKVVGNQDCQRSIVLQIIDILILNFNLLE